jgi:hypothetical protein
MKKRGDLLNSFIKEFTYPLTEFAHEDKPFIYLFYNIQNGLSKIGITQNINERIRKFNSQPDSEIVELIILELQIGYDENAASIEKFLLQYYKNKKVKGEWFSLTYFDVIEIRDLFWHIEGEYIWENIKDVFLGNNYIKIR